MSFKTWFRLWRQALLNIFLISSGKRKSERQRKKEREARIKRKFSGSRSYYFKKNQKRHGRRKLGLDAAVAFFNFCAISLAFILLPVSISHYKYVRHKRTEAIRSVASEGRSDRSDFDKKAARNNKRSKTSAPKTSVGAANAHSSAKHQEKTEKSRPDLSPSSSASHLYLKSELADIGTADHAATGNDMTKEAVGKGCDPSERISNTDTPPIKSTPDIPKSTPRSVKDKYIRKRMIISSASKSGKETSRELSVGTYLELTPEPINPYNPDAIRLTVSGETVGYTADVDIPLLSTCLYLGNRIYGVITDIISIDGNTEYEYEAWIAKGEQNE